MHVQRADALSPSVESQVAGAEIFVERAKNLADKEGLALSRRQHELMIELLKGRDSWALAQLCVDHIQHSKQQYLAMLQREPRDGS